MTSIVYTLHVLLTLSAVLGLAAAVLAAMAYAGSALADDLDTAQTAWNVFMVCITTAITCVSVAVTTLSILRVV